MYNLRITSLEKNLYPLEIGKKVHIINLGTNNLTLEGDYIYAGLLEKSAMSFIRKLSEHTIAEFFTNAVNIRQPNKNTIEIVSNISGNNRYTSTEISESKLPYDMDEKKYDEITSIQNDLDDILMSNYNRLDMIINQSEDVKN